MYAIGIPTRVFFNRIHLYTRVYIYIYIYIYIRVHYTVYALCTRVQALYIVYPKHES